MRSLFAVLLLASPQAAAAATLSLAEAVEAAQSRSLEAKRSALAEDLARIDSELAAFADDPRISLSATAGARWAQKTDSSPNNFKELTKEHAYSGQLAYTLYDFGRQDARLAQAEQALKARELGKDEVDEKLFWSVARAYFAVAAAERLVAITKDQLSVNESKLGQQTRNYRQGLRPESDVVTAEVDVGKSRIAHQQAVFDAQMTRLRLGLLMSPPQEGAEGIAAGPSGAVPTDGISTKAPSAWDGMLAALAKRAASAAERRFAAESDALAAEVAAIDAKTRPTLTATLGAQYGSDGSGDFTPMRPSSTGQLAFTWELPWNGMSRTETHRVSLRRRDLELQIEAEREARRVRERQALQQLDAAKAQHGLLEAQLALAQKQQKLVNDRYRTGKASAIELSTAEAALLGVHLDRTRLSNAVAESLLTLAEARGVRDVNVLSRI